MARSSFPDAGDANPAWSDTPLIAHRGAAAYAPEQTLPAFELGLSQGADLLEHDLHVTRDGILICLHDLTLDRTTDAAAKFPERRREVTHAGKTERGCFAHDFTLAEIKQLDAGAWFAPKFAGTRIPTYQEAIDCARGRAALCTELKDPDFYSSRGVDMLALYVDLVVANRIAAPEGSLAAHVVQSFDELTMRRAAALVPAGIDRTMLVEPYEAETWTDASPLEAMAMFATGFGPGKAVLGTRPEMVTWAHAAGLLVSPWTFRQGEHAPFADVTAEMRHFVETLGVDRCITDYPDRFPR